MMDSKNPWSLRRYMVGHYQEKGVIKQAVRETTPKDCARLRDWGKGLTFNLPATVGGIIDAHGNTSAKS